MNELDAIPSHENPKLTSDLNLLVHELEELKIPITDINTMQHHGVSGAILYRAFLENDNTELVPIIIKREVNIGIKEITALEKLRKLGVPVLEPLHYGPNFLIYPDVTAQGGSSLHEQLLRPGFPKKLITQFIEMHQNLWTSTFTTHPDETRIGYILKFASTIDGLKNITLTEGDKTLTLAEIIDQDIPIIINGTKINSFTEIFNLVTQTISAAYDQGVAFTHGDEGSGNCLVEPIQSVSDSNQYNLFMIDASSAGFRSPYESIAKILGWFENTMTESWATSYHLDESGIHFHTLTTMPPHLYEAILQMRQELDNWLDTPDKRKTLAAFMMMYFFRESRFANQRGRSEILPHLIARAFSFLPTLLDGNQATFPIDPENDPRFSYREIPKDKEHLITHQVININTEADLTKALSSPEIIDSLRTLKVLTFDLDGTLIISDNDFPINGLVAVNKAGLTTSANSAAGLRSIANKIQKASGMSPLKIFSGPIITNNGAQIFRPRTSTENPELNDVIEEHILTLTPELSQILTTISQNPNIEYMGFYPPSVNKEGLDPLNYVVYSQPSSNDSVMARLVQRYGENLIFINNWDQYLHTLTALGAIKIIIRAPEPILSSLNETIIPKKLEGVNITLNSGYSDIVSAQCNKWEATTHFVRLIFELGELSEPEIMHFGNAENDLPSLVKHLSTIVDSDPAITIELLKHIESEKTHGYTFIIKPELLNQFLLKIAEIHESKYHSPTNSK